MEPEPQHHPWYCMWPHHLPNYHLPHWTHPRGNFTPALFLNLDSSTSGYTSFDKARAEGAAITEAEIKDDASICKAKLRSQHLQNPDLGSPRSDQTDYAYPKGYEGSQHSAWNGGKPSSHHCMDFRERHVCKVWTDEQRCLCLKTRRRKSDSRGVQFPTPECPSQPWAHIPPVWVPFRLLSSSLRLSQGLAHSLWHLITSWMALFFVFSYVFVSSI